MVAHGKIYKLNIDIETRSARDLPKVGVYAYARCPHFSVLLFGFSINNESRQVYDLTREELPRGIVEALQDPSVPKWAWNAQFERVCLSAMLGEHLTPRGWYCTMTLAMAHGLPASLARCATAIGLEAQKMTEGKELITFFSIPKTKGGLRYFNKPVAYPEKYALFATYCGRDVEVEHGILEWIENRYAFDIIGEQFWEDYWLDQDINDRGFPIDLVCIRRAERLDLWRVERLSEQFARIGIDKPGSAVQLKAKIAESGLVVKSTNKAAQQVIKADPSTPAEVVAMLEMKAEYDSKATSKLKAMLAYGADDGRCRGTLKFIGANRTGRWAGSGPQPQNLTKNDDNSDVLYEYLQQKNGVAFVDFVNVLLADHTPTPDAPLPSVRRELGKLTRYFIRPKEGRKLIVLDFSSIEARVLAWLAQEQWVLDVFATHGKIYEATASKMYNVPLEDVTPVLRQKGKAAALLLGYQGGVGAFAAIDPLGKIEDETRQEMVTKYRAANENVVQFWYTCNAAAIKAVSAGGRVVVEVGEGAQLSFVGRSGDLLIKLPSSRALVYHDARIITKLVRPKDREPFEVQAVEYLASGENQKGGAFAIGRLDTYGGKLVENITQAVARDLLMEAMRRVAKFADIVMHVHDEIVVECSDSEADMLFDLMHTEMCTTPEWAKGLIIKADGDIDIKYKK